MTTSPRTLLGQLLQTSSLTQDEICKDFIRHGKAMGISTTLHPRTLQLWVTGVIQNAQPQRRRVAADYWGYPFAELVGPPRPVSLSNLNYAATGPLELAASESVIDSIRAVAEASRQLDHSIGPAGPLGTVQAQLQLVQGLVNASSTQAQREPLLAVLAELHQLMGWMLFDLGDMPNARRSLDAGRHAAEAAGNSALVAFILGPSLGFAELDSGHVRDGLDRSYQAQQWARRSENWRLLAFVLTITARAHAKLGEETSCRALLDDARAALAQHRTNGGNADPLWLQVFDESALLGHEGSCLLDLKQQKLAVERLGQEDKGSPKLFTRNRAIWLLDQAVGYRDLLALDKACEQAGEAVALIDSTSSPRTRRRLDRFVLSVRDDTHESVRDLLARLNERDGRAS